MTPPRGRGAHRGSPTSALEGEALTRLSPVLEADRAQAVADLQAENQLRPGRHVTEPGPYALRLSIQEGRLVFDIRRLDETPLTAIALALGPFRGLIKDYQMLVDSHIMAVQEGREARIQAIDMGRRGLHNEGADADDGAPGGQGRDRFRDRAPPVHAGLRAAPAHLTALLEDVSAMKIDGTPYRSVWVDEQDGWSVHIFDQTKLPWSVDILRLTTSPRSRTRSAPCRCAARR